VLRWWALWLPTPQNPDPGAIELPVAPEGEPAGETDPGPLTVRAVRVP
jgi:hypothetical protein